MHWSSIIESQHPVKVETLNLDYISNAAFIELSLVRAKLAESCRGIKSSIRSEG